MPVIQITCPKCNGSVQLDDDKQFGFCMYCGTKIMVSEMITQKVHIDESHKVDTWLTFCETDKNSSDFHALETHSEKILEVDINSYMGWYYKGVAQIGNHNYDGGFDSWAKCVQNCHDGEFLKTFYVEIPKLVFDSVYDFNLNEGRKSNAEEYGFNYAVPSGISTLQMEFTNNADFVVPDDDPAFEDLIFLLLELFKKDVGPNQSEATYYGMYLSASTIVCEIVGVYLHPYVVYDAFVDMEELGRKLVGYHLRPSEEYDITGAIQWDAIESQRVFYLILTNKMDTYLDDCTDEDADKVVDYWQEDDRDTCSYFDIFMDASDASDNIRGTGALTGMSAKAQTKKLAESYVDSYLGPVITKKKSGLFGRFKK